MEIDNYIKGLRLEITDLKKKKNEYLKTIDKNFSRKKDHCPEFDKVMIAKEKIYDAESKLDFVFKLREEIRKNEMQNKKSR